MRRRVLLGAAAVGGAAVLGGSAVRAAHGPSSGRLSEVYAGSLHDAAARFLRPASGTLPPPANTYPGAVVYASVAGAVVGHFPVGDAVRYRSATEVLPQASRVPVRLDTLYDLASVTKLFTAVLVLRLVERGLVDLDRPAERYLPELTGPWAPITPRMLLTHTSGYDGIASAGVTREARLSAALRSTLSGRPGGQYVYADANFIALGVLAERVHGARLDRLVRAEITGPLGLADTGYLPAKALLGRVAATEDEPGRGMVRGQVHDEFAASVGGVSGHAGIFATAYDLGRFGEALMAGGDGVLRPATVDAMLVDQNARFGNAFATHGLGVELNQWQHQGALAGPRTFGHTGFTGTSLVVDPVRRAVLVLLSNAVHPTRDRQVVNPARRAVADAMPRN